VVDHGMAPYLASPVVYTILLTSGYVFINGIVDFSLG